MTAIEIKAADTLFFRDGKPFEMGDDNWANGMFPNMPPGVILGALRASYAAQKGLDKADIEQETRDAAISIYGLMLNDNITFPHPLDLIGYKDEHETAGLALADNLYSSNPFPKLLVATGNSKVKDMDNYRMKLYHFNKYLNGESAFKFGYKDKRKNELLNLNDFITIEPKIGIGRDRQTNTAREGALYRVGMTRLEGSREGNTVALFAQFKNLELEESGFIRLGAENKVGTYKPLMPAFEPTMPEDWGDTGIFKLYLFTPAILKKGIVPAWINDVDFSGEIAGVKIRLLTCNVGRFLSFGGFDVKVQKPKQMWKAVPPGSVYYFELEDKSDVEGQMQKITKYFVNQRNSFSEQRQNEGLGICFIAKYNPHT
jgi:CRISPR-associated protein Cmr3